MRFSCVGGGTLELVGRFACLDLGLSVAPVQQVTCQGLWGLINDVCSGQGRKAAVTSGALLRSSLSGRFEKTNKQTLQNKKNPLKNPNKHTQKTKHTQNPQTNTKPPTSNQKTKPNQPQNKQKSPTPVMISRILFLINWRCSCL